MTEIELDVEETYRFIKKGIIVAKKPNGDRLYFRLGEKSIYGIDLIPLTPQEAKELGIEETYCNNKYFNFEVEESSSEDLPDPTTEEGKKRMDAISERLKKELEGTHNVNMQDLKSVEKGKQILEKREKELAEKEGLKSREELESELADKTAKLEIVAEQALEKKMEYLGLSENQKNRIRTSQFPTEVLRVLEDALKSGEPKGTASLQGQYIGSNNPNDLYHRKFDSYEDMIKTLREIERDKTNLRSKDATLILNELMKRHFALRKQTQIPESSSEMPSIAELTKKKERNPVNPKNRGD